MLPGVHRLVFDGGRVQLTLLIGLAQDWLPTLDTAVDSVFLDGGSPADHPGFCSCRFSRRWRACAGLARGWRPGPTQARCATDS